MEKKYIIINLGSSSKKYSIFFNGQPFSMYFEEASNKKSYINSAQIFLKELKKLELLDNITALGFRVVAPRKYFTQHRKIDNFYLKKLKSIAKIDPLHTQNLILELKKWQKLLPSIPFYGISDSAFHNTLPSQAQIYALPKKITEKYEIYRFGYHGISIASVIKKVEKLYKKLPENIIVCHLSGGSSITAIKNGISVDTSMGFSPLEGVPMVTRIGNIDPEAVIYLSKKIKLDNLKNILFNHSGMSGLTNYTDMRKIISLAQKNNKTCLDALEIFAYSVAKYIGSYFVTLSGIDLLVFTGGIGEGSPLIRSLICQKLEFFGIFLDKEINNKSVDTDTFVNQINSTKIFTCKTDEMNEIFLQTKKLSS